MQLLLYTLLLALVALSLGEGFNAQFMMQVLKPKPSSMAEVQKAVIAKGKPGVVFVTQSWCGACDFLKSNLNESSLKDRMNELREMMVLTFRRETIRMSMSQEFTF